MASTKDFLQLHFIVLIWGFTGILGKMISLPAVELVNYRMFIAAIGMLAWAIWRKENLRLPFEQLWKVGAVGCIVATHWITFFGAIKASNVAVTLGCMASMTLFTSLIEPFVNRRRLFWVEIILGLIIILGLYIIAQFAFHYYWGIILALSSAFLASLFGVLNQRLLQHTRPTQIAFYEMLTGFILVTIYNSYQHNFTQLPWELSTSDLICLFILGWVCTSYPFVVSVELLRRLSPFEIVMAINLEPVYSIVLAYFIFGESEYMHFGFYVGALIILVALFLHPVLDKKFKHQ
ncbi:MAG: DMT family transporter [Chitinophagales bacterium]|jgi:drug/metabolite transporter (DMT)-like permease|nr:DMT family transporter [Chitinophagales bacterium]